MGRLERLELENFKSYKGYQTIGPFYNFTAVIGPNGSGKSNLMDAISFVLGVRSAQLRSHQLQDLIYRPPDEDAPRPSKAFVRAIYTTAEGEEMHFMRRITQAGASEYLLNDRPVNFAQYSKTLQKENILVKARNFLVFQGDVESVASQSPKELTKMIEQISGSLELKEEYDRLKEEMDKANDEMTDMFNRKKGMNNEIKACKQQKEEAEKYGDLLEQRTELETRILLWNLYHNEQEIKELDETLERLAKEADDKKEEHDDLVGGLNDKKKQVAEANKKMLSIERQMKEKEKQIDEKRPALEGERAKVTFAEQKIALTNKAAEKHQRGIEKQEGMIKDLSKRLEDVTRAADQFTAQAQREAEQQGVTLNEEQMQEYRELRNDLENQMASEKLELDSLNRQHRQHVETQARLKTKVTELEAHRKTLEEELEKNGRRENLVQTAIGERTIKLNNLQEELQKNRGSRRELEANRTKLQDQIKEAEAKLFQARVDTRESERERRIMEALESMKKLYPGIHGRIFDLCTPNQSKYRVAITLILGKNMDAIVVESEKTARECIQYMRDQRIGVATFIPLETIKVKPVAERLRRLDRGARLAIDCVKYNQEVHRAMQYAFGDALICDTLAVAKDISFARNEKVKAVTLDGTVIHKSGLMTGGSSDITFKAKKWDQKEIDKTRKSRDGFAEELAEVERNLRKMPEVQSLESEIRGLEKSLEMMRADLDIARKRLSDKEEELDNLNRSLNEISGQIKESEKAAAPTAAEIQRIDAAIRAREDEIFEDFCRRIKVRNIREYEQSSLKVLQEINEKRLEFESLKSRLSEQLNSERDHKRSLENDRDVARRTVEEEQEALKKHEKKQDKISKEIDKLVDERRELRAQLDAHRKTHQDLGTELKEMKQMQEESLQEIGALNRLISSKRGQKRKNLAERHSVFRRCRMEEIDLPLLAGSLDDIPLVEKSGDGSQGQSQEEMDQYKIEDELEVDYSSLDDRLKDDKDKKVEEGLQEELKQLTLEIERSAPNMRAIDKLDEVEERLKHTSSEFETSRKRAKTLRERFMTKRQERQDLFMAAFNHISSNISETYKALTLSTRYPSGGTAYLTLENTEEPFEDGVRYHAMPPMKRFRDMDQLSGGEQTIAALALLFAIHSFRPAPFFVLDEVDSALDNANVNMVARYIKGKASETFQVIQISFKSSLYEKAEALVGIYRDADEGSSKPLTLKLDDYDA